MKQTYTTPQAAEFKLDTIAVNNFWSIKLHQRPGLLPLAKVWATYHGRPDLLKFAQDSFRLDINPPAMSWNYYLDPGHKIFLVKLNCKYTQPQPIEFSLLFDLAHWTTRHYLLKANRKGLIALSLKPVADPASVLYLPVKTNSLPAAIATVENFGAGKLGRFNYA